MEEENKNSKEGLSENFELDRDLRISKQLVLESIRNNGIEGSEEILGDWCDKAEKWASEDPSKRRMIIINFAKYDFYISANDFDGADECVDEAIYMTRQEGYTDLELYIESKIK
jgi:hypothetical protein